MAMIPERTPYSVGHRSVVPLKLGRLQTLSRLPVLPGDSFSGGVSVTSRMSPFKRTVLAPIRYDVYTFFQPLRDYYEGKETATNNRWKTFILDQGRSASTALTSYLHSNSAGRRYPYLMLAGGAFRRDIPWTYYRILESYFEHPDLNIHRMLGHSGAPYVKNFVRTGRDADTEASIDPTLPGGSRPGDPPQRWYGEPVSRLRSLMTSLRQEKVGSDPVKSIPVTSERVDINLTELGFQGNVDRRLTGQSATNRRADLGRFLRQVYGVAPRDWNDARPELIGHERGIADISDVISQGDSRLGQKVSHGVAYIRFGIPDRFFVEHGWLWTVACIRALPFFRDQRFRWDFEVGYGELLADPLVFGQGENQIRRNQVDGASSSSTAIGWLPHHEEWRRTPNWVHPDFTKDENDFIVDSPHANNWRNYVMEPESDDIHDQWFEEVKYGHAQLDVDINLSVNRIIPPSTSSIWQDAQLRGDTFGV